MARKRKSLPKDFDELLAAGDIEVLIGVFKGCELDARGGPAKATAVGFEDCPDDLVRWLVAHGLDVDSRDAKGRTPLWTRAAWRRDISVLVELGADVNARDHEGETPLHAAAESWYDQRQSPPQLIWAEPSTVHALLAAGADVNAKSTDILEWTPLEAMLVTYHGADTPATARIARMLLDAGASTPDDATATVEQKGRMFKLNRESFEPPEFLEEAEEALGELCQMFHATAPEPREPHDGTSRITVTGNAVTTQFDELWDYLVPSMGAAPTVQGEVIRAVGRLEHETLNNGGINWSRDYEAMGEALVDHLGEGTAVAASGELAALREDMDWPGECTLDRLRDLAVAWVLANPDPITLPPPTYPL